MHGRPSVLRAGGALPDLMWCRKHAIPRTGVAPAMLDRRPRFAVVGNARGRRIFSCSVALAQSPAL
jgi:hypothetical protein